MNSNELKCGFCSERSKYICPRCTIQYCSLSCYQAQAHMECTEAFYKEQVLNDLKDIKGSNFEKVKMEEVLLKQKSLSEKENILDITSRLEDVDITDTDAVWERLTQKEKDKFQSCVSRGQFNFVPLWTPWWVEETSSKIEEISSSDGSCRKASKKNIPQILKQLPVLEDVLKTKQPNENLKFCLVEVLLTYTFLLRVFNGDLYDSPEETSSYILRVCKVLSENRVYSDLNTCVHLFTNEAVALRNHCSDDLVTELLSHVCQILKSNDSYVMRALSDLHVFLKRTYKKVKKNDAGLSEQLFGASKKVYFYLLYSVKFESDIKLLDKDIGIIKGELVLEKTSIQGVKNVIDENLEKLKPRKKTLIEEI